MNTWNLMNFQDSMSPIMIHMTFFHEHIMTFMIFILSMIFYLFLKLMTNKFYSNKIINHQNLEFIWTLFPLMILIILAIPSITILYYMEEMKTPNLTIKSIGNQWYWSYEYTQFKNLSFDSFMINNENLNNFRLLDVDNRLIIPFFHKIRILTTSNDVIHSLTIPSLGFKIDSIPGRLNQTFFFCNQIGLFFGQCSEICGVNHSFMPIIIESIKSNMFIKWLKNNL